MPVVSGRVGIGERDAPGSTREQHREDLAESRPRVFERGEEDHLHPLVELFDDRDEVLPRLRQVGELLGEELVPLLECRELFECERIHASELGELASRIR